MKRQHTQEKALPIINQVPRRRKSMQAHTEYGRELRLWELFARGGYAYDWLAAIVVIFINFIGPTFLIPPLERVYSPNDASLDYPYQVRSNCFSGNAN